VSYALNPRYTLTFSQEYNFDFGKNVKNKLAILRKYHRMYYALTLSADKSMDNNALVFSVWPEGVKELGFGDRKNANLNRLTGEEY
ncbi:MAG: hypothetical protein KAJ07_12675, partial [Planctomycetes bacterium]|nr:hypothetical protein [Planctomycetota bacterium]